MKPRVLSDDHTRDVLLNVAISLGGTALGTFIAVWCMVCDFPEIPQ
jgi:hypothetical protein